MNKGISMEKRKHQILSFIYQLRVLSFDQIYTYIFPGLSKDHCSKLVKELVKEGFIEKAGYYHDECHYFLTLAGCKYLKVHGIMSVGNGNIYYPDTVLTPAKLRLSESHVGHQLSLNSFVLKYISSNNGEISYYDEKYVGSVFTHIRPDGILYHEGIYYFLEMDMNTETEKRLRGKWENYRLFLNSSEYTRITAPIKVLFILGGGVTDTSARKYNLRRYIDDNLYGYINNSFNLYIDTPDNLLDMFQRRNTTINTAIDSFTRIGFGVYTGETKVLPGMEYDMRTNLTENGRPVTRNGFIMDFMVDTMNDENMYTYRKIATYPETNTEYRYRRKHDLNYIVIVKDVMEAYKAARDTGVFSDHVYYTTEQRIHDYTLASALFQVDKEGNLYHLNESDFNTRKFEDNILGVRR